MTLNGSESSFNVLEAVHSVYDGLDDSSSFLSGLTVRSVVSTGLVGVYIIAWQPVWLCQTWCDHKAVLRPTNYRTYDIVALRTWRRNIHLSVGISLTTSIVAQNYAID